MNQELRSKDYYTWFIIQSIKGQTSGTGQFWNSIWFSFANLQTTFGDQVLGIRSSSLVETDESTAGSLSICTIESASQSTEAYPALNCDANDRGRYEIEEWCAPLAAQSARARGDSWNSLSTASALLWCMHVERVCAVDSTRSTEMLEMFPWSTLCHRARKKEGLDISTKSQLNGTENLWKKLTMFCWLQMVPQFVDYNHIMAMVLGWDVDLEAWYTHFWAE